MTDSNQIQVSSDISLFFISIVVSQIRDIQNFFPWWFVPLSMMGVADPLSYDAKLRQGSF